MRPRPSSMLAVGAGACLLWASAAVARAPDQAAPVTASATAPDLSISGLDAALRAGAVTSVSLVGTFEHAIAKADRSGPSLGAVIALNPHAAADARRLDAERKAGRVRG